jgi:transcriptional regulator with XRE-family HTH domain
MNLIAEYRSQLGLTQSQLAKKAKVAQSAISQYEAQERQPNGRSLLQLAQALNVNPEALYGDVAEDPNDDSLAIARVTVILDWWAQNGAAALALERVACDRMGTAREKPLQWLLEDLQKSH